MWVVDLLLWVIIISDLVAFPQLIPNDSEPKICGPHSPRKEKQTWNLGSAHYPPTVRRVAASVLLLTVAILLPGIEPQRGEDKFSNASPLILEEICRGWSIAKPGMTCVSSFKPHCIFSWLIDSKPDGTTLFLLPFKKQPWTSVPPYSNAECFSRDAEKYSGHSFLPMKPLHGIRPNGTNCSKIEESAETSNTCYWQC